MNIARRERDHEGAHLLQPPRLQKPVSGTMPEKVETLHPKLEDAQRALEAALDEACETDVANADSAELMRLEESLAVAREAAHNAISVLQRLHRPDEEPEDPRQGMHRVFVDDNGVQWDAFCVYPSQRTSGRTALPAPYNEGWLSLQCANEIRRVTPIPEGWRELPRGDLCQLVEKGAIATRKTPRRTGKTESGESGEEKATR